MPRNRSQGAKKRSPTGVQAIRVAAWAAAGLWTVAFVIAQSTSHVLISDRVNGIHRDLDPSIAPVQIGPMTVRLSSPGNRLEVLEHELRLGPWEESGDPASLRARFRGQAELVAELAVGEMKSQIVDHVELPTQETEIEGSLELLREAAGYRVNTLELPSHVEIQVKSDLGGQLELLCRGFAILSLGGIDCDALGRSLSRVRLPLPKPGGSYFVEASRLTDVERRQLEAYLDQRREGRAKR